MTSNKQDVIVAFCHVTILASSAVSVVYVVLVLLLPIATVKLTIIDQVLLVVRTEE